MNPKTITAKIVVPEWAKWVATDENGLICAYSETPTCGKRDWRVEHGLINILCESTPPRNWRKTLRRLK